MVIGYMFEKISPLIYVKVRAIQQLSCRHVLLRSPINNFMSIDYILPQGKPNTILQELLDSMLLGVTARSPNYKVHPSVVPALLSSLHRYLIGLIRLSE